MEVAAGDIVRFNTALMAAPLLFSGVFWLTSRITDPMAQYPTRPIIQLFFALGMLPNIAIIIMWFIRSRGSALLLIAALLSFTVHTYVTTLDSRFLSGQSGIMGNLFLAAFMVKTAFFTNSLPPSLPRKATAGAYLILQALLLHSLGLLLQTGHSTTAFFQVSSILLAIFYNWLARDIFHGQFTINWVKSYTA